jgi:type IV secretory pathway TrbD component
MTWFAAALCVIVLPGLAILFIVRRRGPAWGLVILAGLGIWLIGSVLASQEARNTPIAPEIFGGQTIGHSHTGGFRQMAWALFVLGPAILWAAIALLLGVFSFRRAQHRCEQP